MTEAKVEASHELGQLACESDMPIKLEPKDIKAAPSYELKWNQNLGLFECRFMILTREFTHDPWGYRFPPRRVEIEVQNYINRFMRGKDPKLHIAFDRTNNSTLATLIANYENRGIQINQAIRYHDDDIYMWIGVKQRCLTADIKTRLLECAMDLFPIYEDDCPGNKSFYENLQEQYRRYVGWINVNPVIPPHDHSKDIRIEFIQVA